MTHMLEGSHAVRIRDLAGLRHRPYPRPAETRCPESSCKVCCVQKAHAHSELRRTRMTVEYRPLVLDRLGKDQRTQMLSREVIMQ